MLTAESCNVSRETFERLEIYVSLLRKWTPRINLVAKSTLPEVWERHIADSLQLLEVMMGQSGHYADLGSGGGLLFLMKFICPDTTRVAMIMIMDRLNCTMTKTCFKLPLPSLTAVPFNTWAD